MALFRIFAIALISWECLPTCAIISSIELSPSPTVEIGETATYTCNATSTTGADPLFAWRITAADGDLIKTLSGDQDNDTDPSDGVASSSVTINVTSNLIGGKIYCVATEAGATSEGTQLFSTIRESTNNAGLGDACSDSVVCTTAFSSCQSVAAAPSEQNVCRCEGDYYDTNGQTAGGLCNAKSAFEAVCDTSVTDSCLTENAECSTVTETCACRAGLVQSGTSCVSDSTAGLGESCVNPEKTCVVTSSVCSTTGLCACSIGYYYQLDNNTCNPKGAVGQECNPSAVDSCSTRDSYCDRSTLICVCEPGRTYNDTTDTCYIAGLGDACSDIVVCTTVFSSCQAVEAAPSVQNVCRCEGDYYDTNGQTAGGLCNAKSALEVVCDTSVTDACLTENAECSSVTETCACRAGLVQSGTSCVSDSTAGLGEACVNPEKTCVVTSSECSTTGLCACSSGYYQMDNNSCNPTGLGDACSDIVVCTTVFSSCQAVEAAPSVQNVCRCEGDYYDTNGQTAGGLCNAKSALEVVCDTSVTDACLTENAECSSVTETCACRAGLVQSGTSCVSDSTAGLGEACVNPEKTCVVTSSECSTTGLCACSSGYYQMDNNSCNPTGLGDACSDIVVCRTAFSSCQAVAAAPSDQNVCRCEGDYYDTNGQTAGGLCNAKSALEAVCDTSVTDSCLTENAECSTVTEICACRAGLLQSGTSCVSDSTAGLGEACVNPEKTCVVTSSECSTTGLCACSSGYYQLDNNICNPKGAVGQECNPSAVGSCSTPDSYCDRSTLICVCETSRTYNDTTDICDIETTTAITTELTTSIEHSGISTATTSTAITTDIATIPTTQATNDTTGITVDTTQHPTTQIKNDTTQITTDATPKPTTQVTNDTTGITSGITSHPTTQVTNNTTELTTDTAHPTTQVTQHPTEITSVTATYSPTVVVKGQSMTFTCTTAPDGVADSYRWFWDGTRFRITETFQLQSVQSDNDGSYLCEASDSYGTMRSAPITLDVHYAPEYILANGGDTVDYSGNLDTDPIIIKCTMSANPEIHTYYFYNSSDVILEASRSNTYTVDDTAGYGTYSCDAQNEFGNSTRRQYFNVQLQTSTEKTGAATEDTTDTVTIVATVLGVITAVLVVIIIIVLCCNYGRCRKENMEVTPVCDDTPSVKPRSPICSPSLVNTKLGTITSTFYLACTTQGEPTTATIENDQPEPRPLVVRSLKGKPRRLRSFGSPSEYYSSRAPNNPSTKRKRRRRRPIPEADSQKFNGMHNETFSYGSVTPPDDYLSSIA